MFDLKKWKTCDLVIMDDIPWNLVPAKKAFFGAQRTFTLTDRYTKKMTLTHGKPLIYLSNIYPWDTEDEREWFEANSVVVHLEHPLFE